VIQQNSLRVRVSLLLAAISLHAGFVVFLYGAMTRSTSSVIAYVVLWSGYALLFRKVSYLKVTVEDFGRWRGYWVYGLVFHALAFVEAGICFIILATNWLVGVVALVGLVCGYWLNPLFVFRKRVQTGSGPSAVSPK
jgi:hypothetical protein